MKQTIRSVALAVAALAALPLAAHEVEYQATLSGAAEAPPNGSPGTGFAEVTIDLDLATMHVEVSFSGLLGSTTASHACSIWRNPASSRAPVKCTRLRSRLVSATSLST